MSRIWQSLGKHQELVLSHRITFQLLPLGLFSLFVVGHGLQRLYISVSPARLDEYSQKSKYVFVTDASLSCKQYQKTAQNTGIYEETHDLACS